MHKAITTLAEALARKQPVVLATVVEVSGASPAKVGAQMVLHADGTTGGTVGGGNLEAAVLADARAALDDGQPRLAHYALTEEGPDAVGVLCGGDVRAFIQPYLPPPRLVIVGGGHIGRPLLQRVYAPIGLDLGGPTPEEIAVAILAEIVAVRREKLGWGETRVGTRKESLVYPSGRNGLSDLKVEVNHEN